MASKEVENLHLEGLSKILADAGLECHRSREDSSVAEDDEQVSQEEEILKELEEQLPEEIPEEQEGVLEEEEEQPRVFPTPSLRRVLPDQERELMAENTIHVLPEVFRTDIDPEAIPKISHTPPQQYIDRLADLVGCSHYKACLAEYWFLDTLAGLLRRAQEDGLEKPTQAILILWFCEWMKEMQHFDAADRQRMIRRFKKMSLDMNNPFYYAQNMLEEFDSDVEEVPPLPTSAYSPPSPTFITPNRPAKKTPIRAAKKRDSSESEGLSFVMAKKARKGLRLIKIEVIDLTDQHNSDGPVLKAQHVVVDPIDEILDMTENVIKKISKTISDRF